MQTMQVTASQIAQAKVLVRSAYEKLKDMFRKKGMPDVEKAVQELIRGNEKTKQFPLRPKAEELVQKMGIEHPAAVPAMMSLLSEETHKENPAKERKPAQPALMGLASKEKLNTRGYDEGLVKKYMEKKGSIREKIAEGTSPIGEGGPASMEEQRPGRMKRPKIDDVKLDKDHRPIDYGHVHELLQEKYGKERGDKTYHGLIERGGGAGGALHFQVGNDIQKEKLKMLKELGKYQPGMDIGEHKYYELWKEWMGNQKGGEMKSNREKIAGEPMAQNSPPTEPTSQPQVVSQEGGEKEEKSVGYDGRIVSLKMAQDNLKALRSGLDEHIKELEGHIGAAVTYASDPRSHVAGPEKINWGSRVKGTIDGLHRTMKALEATADLAVSHL